MADNLRNKEIPFTRQDILIYGNMKNIFLRLVYWISKPFFRKKIFCIEKRRKF